jgi:integrase
VEMTPTLESVMSAYFKEGHPGGLFAFAESSTGPVNGSNNMKALRRVFRGSKWSVIRGYHLFRHSFVSLLAAAGTDQRIIDEMSGHQTDEMRRRYRL